MSEEQAVAESEQAPQAPDADLDAQALHSGEQVDDVDSEQSEQGVLSDEELEALKESNESSIYSADDDSGCSLYDFRDPSRLLNGRLPGLDSVHETFCNGMQVLLKRVIGRAVEVSSGETNLTRLGDLQRSLPVPTSIHGAGVTDRKHSMYIAADGRFVYACVDAFFGGNGGALPTSLEREFSHSERRFMDMLIVQQFQELTNAWAPICAIAFEQPRPVKAANLGAGRDDQIMVVSRFQTNLQPGDVEFALIMPYALLDSLRPYLTAGPRGSDVSRNWRARFGERLTMAEIETRSVFNNVRITFGELMSLQAGDFIPISNQNKISLMIDEHKLYIAEPGVSNGMSAAKVVQRVRAQ